MKRFSIILIVVAIMAAGSVMGETDSEGHIVTIVVEDVAAIEATGNPTFTVTDPTNPGLSPQVNSADPTAKLAYTSIVTSTTSRDISALRSNNLPTGMTLKVTASGTSGNEGTCTAQKTLDDVTAEDVITGIGSCATGLAAITLTYELTVTDADLLIDAAGTDVTVTYTLEEDG